jgi:hypothetical protein
MADSSLEGSGRVVRTEAVPLVSYTQLSASQREALGRLARILEESVQALPELGRSEPHPTCDLELDRAARVALLSGARGTGKTSLLLTLMRQTRTECREQASAFFEGIQDSSKLKQESDRLQQQLTNLDGGHPRLVWLPVLDMEPMAGSTSLLAALMVRLEHLLDSATPDPCLPGSTQYPLALPTDDALGKLRKLCMDMVFSWDSVVDASKGKLSPEEHAETAIRSERKRLRFDRKLGQVLHGIACHLQRIGSYTNPLFVLPVDDIDLCPERAPDVLQLLRMVSTPRLFTLVLGEESHLRVVLEAQRRGRLHQLCEVPGALDPMKSAIDGLVSETTVNALRKLIPPAQRVVVELTKLDEALAFRPPSGGSAGGSSRGTPTELPALRELMKRTPLVDPKNSRTIVGQKVEFLADLFVRNNGAEGDEEGEFYNHCHGGVLRAPMRKIVDLWHALYRDSIEPTAEPERRQELRRFLAETFLSETREDDHLNEADRHALRNTVRREADGGIVLVADWYELTRGLTGKRGWLPSWWLPNEIRVSFAVAGSSRIAIKGSEASEEGMPRASKPLSRGPTEWLMLLHDALQFKELGGLQGRPLSSSRSAALASVRWHGMECAWPLPSFDTFFERQRFVGSWNKATKSEFASQSTASARAPAAAEQLAYRWLSLSNPGERADGWPKSLAAAEGDRSGWTTVLGQLSTAAQGQRNQVRSAAAKSANNERARQFLIGAAVLLAPESGVPIDLQSVEPINLNSREWITNLPEFGELRGLLSNPESGAAFAAWCREHAAEINRQRLSRIDDGNLATEVSPNGSPMLACFFGRRDKRTLATILQEIVELPSQIQNDLDQLTKSPTGNDSLPRKAQELWTALSESAHALRDRWADFSKPHAVLEGLRDPTTAIPANTGPMGLDKNGEPISRLAKLLELVREVRDRLNHPTEDDALSLVIWLHPMDRLLNSSLRE